MSEGQLRTFGFKTQHELDQLAPDIKMNLTMAMKLYYLLEPVYNISRELDASCCGILFCKALELQLRRNFSEGLKERFPDFEIKTNGKALRLSDAHNKDF